MASPLSFQRRERIHFKASCAFVDDVVLAGTIFATGFPFRVRTISAPASTAAMSFESWFLAS